MKIPEKGPSRLPEIAWKLPKIAWKGSNSLHKKGWVFAHLKKERSHIWVTLRSESHLWGTFGLSLESLWANPYSLFCHRGGLHHNGSEAAWVYNRAPGHMIKWPFFFEWLLIIRVGSWRNRFVKVAHLQSEFCTTDFFASYEFSYERCSEIFPEIFAPLFCGS